MKKNKKNKLLIILLIFAIIIIAYMLYFILNNKNISEISEGSLNISSYLSTKNYIKINFDIGPNFMVFKDKKDKCMAVVMPVNELQAYSIEQGVNDNIELRPMIHDLVKDIFDNYNITILLVKVDELKNEVYYANMIIKQDNKILNLDIKPSDALAVSARMKNDVYFRKDLFNNNAKNICK